MLPLTSVVKGAGDVIRGEVNSFADGVGEGIAGRNANERPPTKTDGGRAPETVAQKGKLEMDAGLNGIQR